jgi:hypothetical protein
VRVGTGHSYAEFSTLSKMTETFNDGGIAVMCKLAVTFVYCSVGAESTMQRSHVLKTSLLQPCSQRRPEKQLTRGYKLQSFSSDCGVDLLCQCAAVLWPVDKRRSYVRH